MNYQTPKLLEQLSLVENSGEPLTQEAAIQVTRIIADWLQSQNVGAGRASAHWLREEVEPND